MLRVSAITPVPHEIDVSGSLGRRRVTAVKSEDVQLCNALELLAFDEQGVLNAGLAIEQRAGFEAKPEKWW